MADHSPQILAQVQGFAKHLIRFAIERGPTSQESWIRWKAVLRAYGLSDGGDQYKAIRVQLGSERCVLRRATAADGKRYKTVMVRLDELSAAIMFIRVIDVKPERRALLYASQRHLSRILDEFMFGPGRADVAMQSADNVRAMLSETTGEQFSMFRAAVPTTAPVPVQEAGRPTSDPEITAVATRVGAYDGFEALDAYTAQWKSQQREQATIDQLSFDVHDLMAGMRALPGTLVYALGQAKAPRRRPNLDQCTCYDGPDAAGAPARPHKYPKHPGTGGRVMQPCPVHQPRFPDVA